MQKMSLMGSSEASHKLLRSVSWASLNQGGAKNLGKKGSAWRPAGSRWRGSPPRPRRGAPRGGKSLQNNKSSVTNQGRCSKRVICKTAPPLPAVPGWHCLGEPGEGSRAALVQVACSFRILSEEEPSRKIDVLQESQSFQGSPGWLISWLQGRLG